MKEVEAALYSSNAIMFNAKYVNGFIAPIYIDLRRTLSTVNERHIIIQALIMAIKEHYTECNYLAGVSTAGIPYAAIVAHVLNLPMCYVRQVAKNHGLGNTIEGKNPKDQNVVVVEDVLGSGNNALNVVSTLRKSGANVLGVVSIFSYDLEICIQNFINNNVKYKSLTNFEEVVGLGLKKGIINLDEFAKLVYYKENMPNIAWKS